MQRQISSQTRSSVLGRRMALWSVGILGLLVLACGTGGSDDDDSDSEETGTFVLEPDPTDDPLTAPAGCLYPRSGEGWASITNRFDLGLDPAIHWSAVRDLNPQASNASDGTILLAGEYVCLTQGAADLIRDEVQAPELIEETEVIGGCGDPFFCVNWQPLPPVPQETLEEVEEERAAELVELNDGAEVALPAVTSKSSGALGSESCEPCDLYAARNWSELQSLYEERHLDRSVGVTDWRQVVAYAIADLERESVPDDSVLDHYRSVESDLRTEFGNAGPEDVDPDDLILLDQLASRTS